MNPSKRYLTQLISLAVMGVAALALASCAANAPLTPATQANTQPAEVATVEAPLAQADFEDGAASAFTTPTGEWAVAEADGNKVYATVSDAGRAVVGDPNWANYSVEARFQVAGWLAESVPADQTVGLMARYTDNNNYYLFIYEDGKLKIKKKVEGQLTDLTVKDFPFETGTWYTFKADVTGTNLSLSVNDTQELTATDADLVTGQAGLVEFTVTEARFDDVTVRPLAGPAAPATLAKTDFEDEQLGAFTNPTGEWLLGDEDGNIVYSTLSDGGRAVIGDASWKDYSIVAKLEVMDWLPGSAPVDQTVGLMARYTDNDNYYLFVYEDGQLKIMKKVAGTITELAVKPYPDFSTETWYTFKAVVQGSNLTFLVDGVPELTATDTELTAGQAGFIEFSVTEARFDDLLIREAASATP